MKKMEQESKLEDICLKCEFDLGEHCEEAEFSDTVQTENGRCLECKKFKLKKTNRR